MSHFVLDASVAVAWCFEEETTDYTEKALDALVAGQEAVVPPLWPYEVANALLAAIRSRRLIVAKAASFLQRLQVFSILVDGESVGRVFAEVILLGEAQGLTAYDAAYLELAIRNGLPLVTIDRDLKKAARAVGVPTVIE